MLEIRWKNLEKYSKCVSAESLISTGIGRNSIWGGTIGIPILDYISVQEILFISAEMEQNS